MPDIDFKKPYSIKQAMRSETKILHDLTEQHSFMKGFLASSLTEMGYRKLLFKLYRCLLPLEISIKKSDFLTKFSSVADRIYFSALNSELGQDIHSQSKEWFHIPSQAFLAGMLYAMEGSALGGRLIYSRLRWASTDGYFAKQAQLAMVRWPKFVKDLEGNLSAKDLEAAVAGARCVFEAFGRGEQIWKPISSHQEPQLM